MREQKTANTANHKWSAAITSLRTNHFDQNPAKGGIPAIENIKIKIKNENNGLSFAKPLNCSMEAVSLSGRSNNAAKAAIPIKE